MPYVRVVIKKSTNPKKKLMAVLYDKDNKTKTIFFGSAGASDFTKNKDEERKKRYITSCISNVRSTLYPPGNHHS